MSRPTLDELGRSMLADELRRHHRATAEVGVPTSVADGLHIFAVTRDEIRAGLELASCDPARLVDLGAVMSAERVALCEVGRLLLALHASDLTVPNGYVPRLGPDIAATNFGQSIAVVDAHAVACLLLYDSRVTAGEPISADYVPLFDTVTNVWVAHRHRRSGVASALLELARSAYPLVELQRPFTPAGAAWAAACAPDLVDVGRNDRCPCGSGVKFKRCCGARRAA